MPPAHAALSDAARALASPDVTAHAARLASLEIVATFGIAALAASGVADDRLLWIFVSSYLTASALAFAAARGVLSARAHARVLVCLAGAFLSGTLLLALVADAPDAAVAPFALALIAGFAIKEAGFLDALKSVHAGASDGGARRTSAIALLSGLQPVLVALALLAAGALGDLNPSWPFALAAAGGVSAVYAALRARPPAPAAAPAPSARAPAAVWLLVATSTLYNAASLLKSRVLVPVYAVVAARALGLDDNVYSVLGLAAGLVGVAAVLSASLKRRLKDAEAQPRRMIVAGIVSTSLLVLLWGALDLAFVSRGETWALAAVAVVVLLQTATTQVWNVGFFGELTRQADLAGEPAGAAERTRRYAALWQLGKNLGAPCGFAVAAWHAHDLLQAAGLAVTAVGAATLTVGLGYALLSRRLEPRAPATSA